MCTAVFWAMAGQRPAAIVSPQPGTTRDVVESTLDIGGYPIVVRCVGVRVVGVLCERLGWWEGVSAV